MKYLIVFLNAILLLTNWSVIASTTNSTVKVQVTLIKQPECVVNEHNSLDIDFGEIIASKIDGVNYLTKINYTISCTNIVSNALKIKLLGTASKFDPSAFETNMEDLGIALKANNSPVIVNDWINFEYPNLPILHVVPVKSKNAVFTGGGFHAGATLLVDYQ